MPPKKKAKTLDPAVAAKLKEIEGRRLAIEAERVKKEQEMLALLEEQEALLRAELEEEEGQIDEDEAGDETDNGEVQDKEGQIVDPEAEEGQIVDPEAEEGQIVNPEAMEGQAADVKPEPPVAAESTSDGAPASKTVKPEPSKNGMLVLEKTWDIYTNKLFGNLYKERETKFFITKSASHANIDLAFEKKVWATTKVNEIRWNEAFMAHTNVLLFFSAQGSGAFQGVARIAAKSSLGPKVAWTIPPNLTASSLSAVFRIDWLSQQEITFEKLTHLRNTWNRNKLVKVARDGQEVSWKTGCALALMFPIDGSGEYDQLVTKMKKRRSEIGPKQAVTASSRSIKKRKNLDKPVRPPKGINPSGYKPNRGGIDGGRESSSKRFRYDTTGRMSGANTAPLGNQPGVGTSSLFFTG